MVFRCHFVFSPLACCWCLCLALHLHGRQPRLEWREQEGLAGTLQERQSSPTAAADAWDDVMVRETVDTVTGKLLESVHVLDNPARASNAERRLDRLRDIETLVTLAETASDDEAELVDLTLDTAGSESKRPIDDIGEFVFFRLGEKWADCESE